MNTQNQNNPSNENLCTVENIIRLIETKSAGGGYIYRGEHKCYPKVSSSLYREFGVESEDFDIEVVQKEMLTAAKKHTGDLPQDFRVDFATFLNRDRKDTDEAFDIELLTELQHHGGNTNLIDFTTDYRIALFFACDGPPDEDGRIILQKTEAIRDWIWYPQNPRHRVVAQKSVFVRPSKGFIELHQNDIVTIQASLKQRILEHLRNYHGISTETIYNDLHGFIKNQRIHGSGYTEFYRGFACQDRANKATTDEEKQIEYEKSIAHYTKAIKLKPDFSQAYCNRGITYGSKGEVDRAIGDYTKAIQLNPNNAAAYYNLGNTYKEEGDFNNAITYYTKAIELQPDFSQAYCNLGIAYNRKGEIDKAIENYNVAIDLDANDALAHYNRGLAHYNKGEIDNAIKDYTEAIQLNLRYADAYNNRGNAYDKKGDFDNAIKDRTKAIQLRPDHAVAYYNLGNTYKEKGDFNNATKNYTKTIHLDPRYTAAYYNRGWVWLHFGKWKKAKSDLTTARDLGLNIISAFRIYYNSTADFKQKTGFQLPEDIAAMLTPP